MKHQDARQDITTLPVLACDDRLADPATVWTPLREHGAVLLRRAAISAAAFEIATAPFAEQFRIHQDPERRGYHAADTTQSVTAGHDAIGLHAVTTRRDGAFRSGAQFVSTDYPEVSPFGSGYIARLPGADGLIARCNPVSAPSGCRDEWLEPRLPPHRAP